MDNNLKMRPLSIQLYNVYYRIFICVGDAICKSCIGDFTHSQFEDQSLSERLSHYLIRLFWIGHIGALFLILIFLAIVEYTKFELAYGLTCVCLLAGLLSFITAWNKYEVYGRNKSSVLKMIYSIIFSAKRKQLHYVEEEQREILRESFENKDRIQHWLDFAKHSFGGTFADDAVDQTKSFFKVSLLFLSFIPYWVTNAQVYGTFIFQDFHLNRSVYGFQIPVTWLTLFHVAAILVFVQLMDKLINPFCRRKGLNFSPSWRISLGFLFGLASMVSASFLELVAHTKEYHQTTETFHMIGIKNVSYVEDLHVFWAIPQYAFLGISEVLIGLTGLGIACRLCKGVLQKAITSLYYFTIACGHLVSFAVIQLDWFSSTSRSKTSEKMMVFFLSMAGCCGLSFLLFLLVIWKVDFEKRPSNMPKRRSWMSSRSTTIL